MKKAVFLDRDGVINAEIGTYVHQIVNFKFNQGLIEALQLLLKNNFILIVITNQGGIAKGIYDHNDLQKIHHFMLSELTNYNIKITDIFHCPHHNQISNCLCRKPQSLLIEKAISKHNIDVANSFMIGDSERDILAAQKLGLKAFKITSNQNIFPLVQNSITNVV